MVVARDSVVIIETSSHFGILSIMYLAFLNCLVRGSREVEFRGCIPEVERRGGRQAGSFCNILIRQLCMCVCVYVSMCVLCAHTCVRVCVRLFLGLLLLYVQVCRQ